MSRARLLLVVAIAFAAVYFVVDVRQRARIDRKPKQHRTDMTVYLAAAEALAEGDDPYAATNPRGYRYVYPPLLAILFLPLAGWNPANAALVWFVLSALALGWSLVWLARMPRAGSSPGWRAVAVAAVICLGFAHQGFQRGQVTHLLLGLQVGALACLLGRRFLWAGVLLGVAGALRLTPLLPAAAVGLGLLWHGLRHRRVEPWLAFGTGVLAALALCFVVLPWGILGKDRAREVSGRWLAVTRDLQAGHSDLASAYRINEWRFKNQAPRRVAGTWTGWILGEDFAKERPLWSDPSTAHRVDGFVAGLGLLVLFVALALGLGRLRDPADPGFAGAYAVVLLLPVLVTRYAWPTHYLMALPALVFAAAASCRRWRGFGLGIPILVFFAGTLLFYAAHARPLQWLGEAGCLLLACVAFLVLVTTRAPRETA